MNWSKPNNLQRIIKNLNSQKEKKIFANKFYDFSPIDRPESEYIKIDTVIGVYSLDINAGRSSICGPNMETRVDGTPTQVLEYINDFDLAPTSERISFEEFKKREESK